MSEADYWKVFWNTNPIIKESELQKQIGRTINKVPIDKSIWLETIADIQDKLELKKEDKLLDICCGNGLLTLPFSKECAEVTAVDVSETLIKNISDKNIPNITTYLCDIMEVDFPIDSFDKIVFYFALQHFNMKQTVILFEKIYNWLKPDGICFIGDIPDVDLQWQYFDTPERVSFFFSSITQEKPILGTWFKRDMLETLASYRGFQKFQAYSQPDFMINSRYRFDFIMKK